MQLIQLTDNTADLWDKFVSNHPFAWIGHLSSIARIETLTSGAINRSILMVDSSNKVLGVLPLYEMVSRELRLLPIKTISTGSHFTSGPLFDTKLPRKTQYELQDMMMLKLIEYIESLEADRLIITYPAIIGGQPGITHYGFYPFKKYGFKENNIVSMLLDLTMPEDLLLANLKGNCRNMIRRAEKENAHFEILNDEKRWLECYELNRQTLRYKAYSIEAMKKLWEQIILPGYGIITAAIINNQVVNVAVTIGINQSCYYWMGFNSRPPLLSGGGNFVLWNTILHWKKRGMTSFEMGSIEFTGEKLKNISSFKQSFGGKPYYLMSGTLEIKYIKRKFIDLIDGVVSYIREKPAHRILEK